ncbi:MAG: tetratricopeptide repeat protein, partial [Candidatus Sulfotelmatobacter sp.]
SAAAETLRSKGSTSGAEEVLQRMLTLDPGNGYALLMQGRNLLEAGDAEAAIESLQKVSDLDSNPDGLRDLLKAYLKTGRLSDAGTLASKLLTVHNDLNSISTFADALMQAGQFENALQVYDQHAERLLAENSDKVLKNLHSVIGHVRDNPASLEKLLDLFHKAGDNSHTTEVIELLAHASVQSGDLPRARDLYQKLTTMEPGNPLHMSNYQQVASQISGDSGATLISAEEATVIVDELEATAPSIHQHYSDAVALAVRSALTDAELFISYNMPAKAMGPLLSALPQAPTDLRLNQRLASLHTRAGRFAEAGVCCRTLQEVYSEAGYPEEATRYGELADRYQERSGLVVLTDAVAEDAVAVEAQEETSTPAEASAPWPAAPPQPTEDAEFAIVSDPEQDQGETQEEAQEEISEEVEEDQVEEDQVSAVAESPSAAAEIDLSSEWDDSVVVEADASAAEAAEAEITDAVGEHKLPADEVDEAKAAETVEEVRFYLEHGMPEQASAAFEKLQTVTNDEAILSAMEAEIQAASQPAPAAEEEAAAAEPAAEFTVDETSAEEASAEITIEEPPAVEELPTVVEEAPPAPPVPAPKRAAPPVWHAKPAAPKPVAAQPPVAPPPVAPQPAVLQEFVSDLESSLGDNFLPGTISHEAQPAAKHASAHAQPELEPIGNAAPTSFGVPEAEPMGEFVADLEASLGEDFLKGAPVAEPQPAPQTHAAPRVEAPAASAPAQPRPAAAPQVSAPIAASVAAGAVSSGTATTSPQMPPPQKPAPAIAPQISPGIPSTAPAAKSSPFGEDAGVDLAEMFGELKHDLEVGASTTEEDPETHYNLGIAFREMGLLDEAIGELQKTCQAVERGHAFPQVMQTYTWLAQCFLDKGLPEAAIRWYQKALSAPGIDEETRTALHYELAAAYETAGDKASALKHFMEVYGRNIDYRDVAERIKPLKS